MSLKQKTEKQKAQPNPGPRGVGLGHKAHTYLPYHSYLPVGHSKPAKKKPPNSCQSSWPAMPNPKTLTDRLTESKQAHNLRTLEEGHSHANGWLAEWKDFRVKKWSNFTQRKRLQNQSLWRKYTCFQFSPLRKGLSQHFLPSYKFCSFPGLLLCLFSFLQGLWDRVYIRLGNS